MYNSLDERKRPEDVAKLILEALTASQIFVKSAEALTAIANPGRRAGHAISYMSDDFSRSMANLEPQLAVADRLFFPEISFKPLDQRDLESVITYIEEIEKKIGKRFGKNDYKNDRLNSAQRAAEGITISRRQYNKRFRLAAKLEEKAARRSLSLTKRSLTLASKSRLASQLPYEEFAKHPATAAFISYYAARCNLRSTFTVNSQVRAYDEVCATMMAGLRRSKNTNWFAIAHIMPDAEVVAKLTDEQKGILLGRYYEMLMKAGRILDDLWKANKLDAENMIVQRGNDSSSWNLVSGAWNKLRDGWFSLCQALGFEDLIDSMCFGKVMRLMAADVAYWHRSLGKTVHDDTSVWASLPLPWTVLFGEARCNRQLVEIVCDRYKINPLTSGWIARQNKKTVEPTSWTPELVHGIQVASPAMAKAFKQAGIFSGKDVDLEKFRPRSKVDSDAAKRFEIDLVRQTHRNAEMNKLGAKAKKAGKK